MKKNKCEKMIACSKERSEEKHKAVMDCITDLLQKGEQITVNKVSTLSGVSPPTIYKYLDAMELINKHRKTGYKKIKRSEDSKDALIATKNQRIASLTKALEEAEKDAGYKQKYLELLQENKILKKRIEDMLSDDW